MMAHHGPATVTHGNTPFSHSYLMPSLPLQLYLSLKKRNWTRASHRATLTGTSEVQLC